MRNQNLPSLCPSAATLIGSQAFDDLDAGPARLKVSKSPETTQVMLEFSQSNWGKNIYIIVSLVCIHDYKGTYVIDCI